MLLRCIADVGSRRDAVGLRPTLTCENLCTQTLEQASDSHGYTMPQTFQRSGKSLRMYGGWSRRYDQHTPRARSRIRQDMLAKIERNGFVIRLT